MSKPVEDANTGVEQGRPVNGDQDARQEAIREIERRRRFHMDLAVSSMVLLLVTAIWAISEFNNAGGWPTEGFSESSSIPHVWNMWILYPLIGWAFYVGVRAWKTYLQKPISEREIEREMERQAGSLTFSGSEQRGRSVIGANTQPASAGVLAGARARRR